MIYPISYVSFQPTLLKRVLLYVPKSSDTDSLVELEILFYRSPEGYYYVDQLCDNCLIYDHDPFDDFEDALSFFHHLCDRFILNTDCL